MRKLLPMLLVLAPAVGCASWYLNGAKMADRDYSGGPSKGMKAPVCTLLADKSQIAGSDATYHFVSGGEDNGLFERSPDGTGALIQNRWSAEDGEHYFTWVQSTGWEYVFPKASQPQRIVYVGVTTKPGPNGTTQPASAPSAICPLILTE